MQRAKGRGGYVKKWFTEARQKHPRNKRANPSLQPQGKQHCQYNSRAAPQTNGQPIGCNKASHPPLLQSKLRAAMISQHVNHILTTNEMHSRSLEIQPLQEPGKVVPRQVEPLRVSTGKQAAPHQAIPKGGQSSPQPSLITICRQNHHRPRITKSNLGQTHPYFCLPPVTQACRVKAKCAL